ncbi:MAG: tripartite tricarboxylate transporter permease [Verrucomicrobiae bacterium]|jgi:putative tricarboxylic transport membrane protein|nr:tripartite tricarboxylate transporter permease [Verrucomicrobiae bacterium]
MDPVLLIWIFLGVTVGVLVGAVPGLTGAMVISLSVPLTFGMAPEPALALLVSMYVGSVSGGLITATLLRIPGTPASIITTLDGYPMAKEGRPGRALGLGMFASLFGGLASWLVLVLLARPLADWSTRMGPADMFSLVLFALVLIAVVSRESLWAGIFSGLLGIFCALPGQHPALGHPRMTFGIAEMDAGFRLLPVLLGLFAVSQVLRDVVELNKRAVTIEVRGDSLWLKWSEWRTQLFNLIRSSALGSLVGVLPGVGANVGSILAYGAAKAHSRTPERFGQGCDEGIVASEAANNATVGGALVPLVALGIPGSVVDAILLGALVIHGLQPGPLLFTNNPEIVGVITNSYLVANLFMFVVMMLGARFIAKLSRVPKEILIPVILTFCVVGCYALGNRMFDVWVMLIFGLVGFGLDRLRVPLAPFVIGFVLAPMAEENLCAALMLSGGSWLPFFTRPISAVFLVIALAVGVSAVVYRPRGTSQQSP